MQSCIIKSTQYDITVLLKAYDKTKTLNHDSTFALRLLCTRVVESNFKKPPSSRTGLPSTKRKACTLKKILRFKKGSIYTLRKKLLPRTGTHPPNYDSQLINQIDAQQHFINGYVYDTREGL